MPSHVTLPVEIWERVVELLPTRDQASASFTCSALHCVQPRELDFHIHNLAVLLWIQRHRARAQRMRLTFGAHKPRSVFQQKVVLKEHPYGAAVRMPRHTVDMFVDSSALES
jgi:hypothetical protein